MLKGGNRVNGFNPTFKKMYMLGMSVFFSLSVLLSAHAQKVVLVEEIEQSLIQPRQKISGNLKPYLKSMISSLETGAISQLHVREGHRVNKGEVIATLNSQRLQVEYDIVLAEIEFAQSVKILKKAELDAAKKTYESYVEIFEDKAISEKAFRDIEKNYKVALAQFQAEQANIEAHQSRLRQLLIRLDDMSIRSPFDGVVVRRLVEVGEWVTAGKPIIELSASNQLEAWFEVPERLYSKLLLDQHYSSIELHINHREKSFVASEVRVVPEVDERSRMFQIIGLVDEPINLLPGMPIEGWIMMGKSDPVLHIHQDALVRTEYGDYVYVVDENDGRQIAKRQSVSVQFETSDRVVISPAEGLQLRC